MTETIPRGRGPGRKWKPGETGNPKGRPPGATLHGELRAMVRERWEPIVKALIGAAEDGDVQAASLLVSRVAPAVKPVQEPVRVEVTGRNLSEKAASILDAVTEGRLSPTDGKMLLDGVGQVAKIQEFDELTRRIEALEGRQK